MNPQAIVDVIVLGLLGVIAFMGREYYKRIERHMTFSHDINNNFAIIQLWMDAVNTKLGLPSLPPLKTLNPPKQIGD